MGTHTTIAYPNRAGNQHIKGFLVDMNMSFTTSININELKYLQTSRLGAYGQWTSECLVSILYIPRRRRTLRRNCA